MGVCVPDTHVKPPGKGWNGGRRLKTRYGVKSSLVMPRKKVQNSIFVRPSLHGANIFKICFTNLFIKQIFGKALTSHIQLVLNLIIQAAREARGPEGPAC